MIEFNQPYFTGKEVKYIKQALGFKKLSGNGFFTQKCQSFFEKKYAFKKCLLTHSCTGALEMSAILLDFQPGDEIIMPSFTFVSTANAFVLRGATVKFADSSADHPNIDNSEIERLITEKTKAIVVVHYAGIACDMDKVMSLARKHNLFVIEDAAHSIDSYYKGKPLGSLGDFASFSFHETKNLSAGEGGMLVINNEKYIERAEIIWEKGTNRAAFYRGETDKYSWVDIGSSFLPSEVVAAFLLTQIENLEDIQKRRVDIWNKYFNELQETSAKEYFQLPEIPSYATKNGHIFYLVCRNYYERSSLIDYLKSNQISSVFHYVPLHNSPFYSKKYVGPELTNAIMFSDQLLRLPLYYDLSLGDQNQVIRHVKEFFKK